MVMLSSWPNSWLAGRKPATFLSVTDAYGRTYELITAETVLECFLEAMQIIVCHHESGVIKDQLTEDRF